LVAAFAQERVSLANPSVELGPLAAEPLLLRCGRLFGRVRRRSVPFATRLGISPPRSGNARVVAVETHEMKPRFRNVHEEPGQEVLAIEGLSIDSCGLLVQISSDGAVEV
jgi:hypothetical protein